jgi:endonuclease YncB( thermonuclease family)
MTPTILLCLVVAITDGDTIKARCGQPGAYDQITVRISAIDAPESRQAFGQRSKQHLSDLCFQRQATISPKTTDKYGRTVGDVECQGRDVATEQVRAGMAWYYVKYGKGREQLQAVETDARGGHRGLWAQHAEPPWEWRKRPIRAQGDKP